ncbi:MAG: squalene--hopene cyclase [Mariprofundaceae bacterium]|nr:squalene--hopene cyclase [Mariprofundaceae bacterium]
MQDRLEFRLSGTDSSAEVQAFGISPRVTRQIDKSPEIIEGDHATDLNRAVNQATHALLTLQHNQGYWSFELEADCTIPAEYILMMHFTGEVDESLQSKLANYLRAHQGSDGGWPLYQGGKAEISCSVKNYYALKLAGDSPSAVHMNHARQFILEQGGAARCNVFTRIELAKYGQIPWRGVPFMPAELMLFPRWFPFHVSKISYWSRTVMVPLLILYTLRVQAKNPCHVNIRELFTTPPEQEKNYFPVRSGLNRLFLHAERTIRHLEPLIPHWMRQRALKKAECWMLKRLGEGGLGAIFPAMINAYESLIHLGYPENHPVRKQARQALDDLLIKTDESAWFQPCNSPVWDTAIACLALQEAGSKKAVSATGRGLDWLTGQQLRDAPGDWQENHPDLTGGGWAFQFENSFYPDLDDTGMVAWTLDRAEDGRYKEAVLHAMDWACGMQSRNGGFASFDADNTHSYLNHIPFADHGALLDPPTSDVSARLATVLGHLARQDTKYQPHLDACLNFLKHEQEENGAWFGRWGTNYLYGTWSVVTGLIHAGIERDDPMILRAVEWLKSMQHLDGGWGESNDTYEHPEIAGQGQVSTTFQTAWAMLALMEAGEHESHEVQRGVRYLIEHQRHDGLWQDEAFTAPGFPCVFYLKYHGYDKYFPLWALARYRNIKHSVTK